MSLIYEIMIFTASAPGYANAIINYIDPGKKFFYKIDGYLIDCIETIVIWHQKGIS